MLSGALRLPDKGAFILVISGRGQVELLELLNLLYCTCRPVFFILLL
jgi:hypothetical protein